MPDTARGRIVTGDGTWEDAGVNGRSGVSGERLGYRLVGRDDFLDCGQDTAGVPWKTYNVPSLQPITAPRNTTLSSRSLASPDGSPALLHVERQEDCAEAQLTLRRIRDS